MSPRSAQWFLFAAMACTMPLAFVFGAGAGVLPLLAIAAMLHTNASDPGFLLLVGLHLAVYGPALYLLARFGTRWLSSRSPRALMRGVTAALAFAVVLGLLPLYGFGHNGYEAVSLYRLYRNGALG